MLSDHDDQNKNTGLTSKERDSDSCDSDSLESDSNLSTGKVDYDGNYKQMIGKNFSTKVKRN